MNKNCRKVLLIVKMEPNAPGSRLRTRKWGQLLWFLPASSSRSHRPERRSVSHGLYSPSTSRGRHKTSQEAQHTHVESDINSPSLDSPSALPSSSSSSSSSPLRGSSVPPHEAQPGPSSPSSSSELKPHRQEGGGFFIHLIHWTRISNQSLHKYVLDLR